MLQQVLSGFLISWCQSPRAMPMHLHVFRSRSNAMGGCQCLCQKGNVASVVYSPVLPVCTPDCSDCSTFQDALKKIVLEALNEQLTFHRLCKFNSKRHCVNRRGSPSPPFPWRHAGRWSQECICTPWFLFRSLWHTSCSLNINTTGAMCV